MTHVGDQLKLELRMPWDGYSPRGLTGSFRRFSFLRKGMTRPDPEPIEGPVQLELFPEGTHYGS